LRLRWPPARNVTPRILQLEMGIEERSPRCAPRPSNGDGKKGRAGLRYGMTALSKNKNKTEKKPNERRRALAQMEWPDCLRELQGLKPHPHRIPMSRLPRLRSGQVQPRPTRKGHGIRFQSPEPWIFQERWGMVAELPCGGSLGSARDKFSRDPQRLGTRRSASRRSREFCGSVEA
jgi:hypothetical protein